ncbi:MAG: hypothetical protein UR93_C0010G0005 [Berkelbacteria bacterium GW2011_GWA2_35_9]|uniref:Uncharacterized protein n=1 Tax=Berkelbacteria bacterium GW2011_GWA2_35_9 TaxID=1618333 RepID=A0A0G0D3D3_9BACT|nr:MAG: hypothetical protein UR93_C0010G0005 [Berkelbacteria bacterium GW2011_GWA2_35_9]
MKISDLIITIQNLESKIIINSKLDYEILILNS